MESILQQTILFLENRNNFGSVSSQNNYNLGKCYEGGWHVVYNKCPPPPKRNPKNVNEQVYVEYHCFIKDRKENRLDNLQIKNGNCDIFF